MGAMELVEQSQLAERQGSRSGRQERKQES